MRYQHTQIGYLILCISAFMALYFAFLLTIEEMPLGVEIFMVFILLIIASFATLSVSIDQTYLRIRFGWGIYRKKFLLSDITSAQAVKNHWYYGWGIRYWHWPKMIIFNISGFDAVEIRMNDGKIYRIGTDEPKRLESAILAR